MIDKFWEINMVAFAASGFTKVSYLNTDQNIKLSADYVQNYGLWLVINLFAILFSSHFNCSVEHSSKHFEVAIFLLANCTPPILVLLSISFL